MFCWQEYWICKMNLSVVPEPPDAKDNKTLVKEYYRKLRVDLQTEVDAIANEIGELSKRKIMKKTDL